jgi:hypothetical protein
MLQSQIFIGSQHKNVQVTIHRLKAPRHGKRLIAVDAPVVPVRPLFLDLPFAVGLRTVQAGIPNFFERSVAVDELFGELVSEFLREIVDESEPGARRPAVVRLYDRPVIGEWRGRIRDAFVVPALSALSFSIGSLTRYISGVVSEGGMIKYIWLTSVLEGGAGTSPAWIQLISFFLISSTILLLTSVQTVVAGGFVSSMTTGLDTDPRLMPYSPCRS